MLPSSMGTTHDRISVAMGWQWEHDICVICCNLQKLQSPKSYQFTLQLAWLPASPRVAKCEPRPRQTATNHKENKKEPHWHQHHYKQCTFTKNQLYSQLQDHITTIWTRQGGS